MVRVRVPATTANFGPGFDCIGAALGLYNYIEMEFWPRPVVEVIGEGQGELIRDESNLVYRAATRVLSEAGVNKALRIKLENNIPLARGLGSSAACIAGGMMAANRLLGGPVPFDRIINLATEMEGHPDNVVPALIGGFSISILHEGKVIYRSFPMPDNLRFVAAIPRFHLETVKARKVLPREVPLSDAVFNLSRSALMVAAFCRGDFTDIEVFCQDKLHQPYRSQLIPGMEKVIKMATQKGALGCFLSGAGPAVICLAYEKQAPILGESMVEIFLDEGIESEYKILTPDGEGTIFL
ncbi:homoserine kinase [Biomaibacter acetigenes]|uniref:Homoserine kinase n=1 Tax=Biomaibacter acetigenes TaxID=2316383 RepID=A0A3G2R4L1_9FIRM|nr:homoserine kinase [Biomaibacter acetigenes]AYO30386.1 homoserine kinase [Biomaibacter acetigenes]